MAELQVTICEDCGRERGDEFPRQCQRGAYSGQAGSPDLAACWRYTAQRLRAEVSRLEAERHDIYERAYADGVHEMQSACSAFEFEADRALGRIVNPYPYTRTSR